MTMTYEDELGIYEIRRIGTISYQISEIYDVNLSNLQYVMKFRDSYDTENVRKKNSYIFYLDLKND